MIKRSSSLYAYGVALVTASGFAVLVGCAPQSNESLAGGSRTVSAPGYAPLSAGQALAASAPSQAYATRPSQAAAQRAVPDQGVSGFAVAHLGNRLTSTEGRTLYVYDHDPLGQSICVGECARIWPPYLVEPGAAANLQSSGQTGVIQRPDGRQQWAVAGRALYLYAGDQAAHQALGEGLDGGTWHSVPYPVPASLAAQQASTIPPFPGSSEGLPVYYGSGSK